MHSDVCTRAPSIYIYAACSSSARRKLARTTQPSGAAVPISIFFYCQSVGGDWERHVDGKLALITQPSQASRPVCEDSS